MMFHQLARSLGGANQLFQTHPQLLSWWLDEAWRGIRLPSTVTTGTVADILGAPPGIVAAMDFATSPPSNLGFPTGAFVWPNLIHAYLLESTGVVEIMAEVLRRNSVGETLDAPTIAAQQWLRSTEELFFRDPPPFQAFGIGSHIRRYGRESRRGAYWRMFGLDLPFPIPTRWADPVGGAAWKLDVGTGVNNPFRQQWTEFLRQVWLGIENRRNIIGANQTDVEYIAQLCKTLGDMLRMRRQGGQLAREEAAYVAMMSWFEVTLRGNTPIVDALNANASSPAERLSRIGQRVGMAPTARSRELFELARPASQIIRSIELHRFDTRSGASALFPIASTTLSERMNKVIDLWQSATGEVIKEPRVTVTQMSGTSQPTRIPAPSAPALGPGVPAQQQQPVGMGGNGRAR
jgi:hypothetical protein